jgi:hypothetical protein
VATGQTAQPVNDWQTVAPNDWQTVGSAPPPANPGVIQTLKNNFNANTQGAAPGDNPVKGFIENIGQGGGQTIRALAHPLNTISSLASSIAHPLDTAHAEVDQLRSDPSRFIGNAIGQTGTSAILGGAAGKVAGVAGPAIREAAIGDPDAAAVRGLKVPAGSPKMQRTVSAVQTARPYLQGAESQADLQARIPQAKSEIWGPYQQAIDAGKNLPVKGPDGPTTIGELENERLQLSALNRGLKTREPEAIQLAQQKGMNQAQLLDRERAVQSALDPELTKMGIKPQEIRKTFGAVAQIGQKVSGKSNIIEPQEPYGFSKIKDLSLTKPLSNIPTLASAGKDIAAGRYMSASPIDTGIREGFRGNSPKPDLGRLTSTLQAPPPLPRNLLNAPPIQLGGNVQGYQPPPMDAGTIPSRFGRLLPEPAPHTPMSSHSDIFPDQLPGARIRIPRTIEGQR